MNPLEEKEKSPKWGSKDWGLLEFALGGRLLTWGRSGASYLSRESQHDLGSACGTGLGS